jgi:hypothetical protein
MKICRNLFHLITPLACFALATAQADLAPGRILSLNLDPERYYTSIATRICNVSSPARSCQFRGPW